MLLITQLIPALRESFTVTLLFNVSSISLIVLLSSANLSNKNSSLIFNCFCWSLVLWTKVSASVISSEVFFSLNTIFDSGDNGFAGVVGESAFPCSIAKSFFCFLTSNISLSVFCKFLIFCSF